MSLENFVGMLLNEEGEERKPFSDIQFFGDSLTSEIKSIFPDSYARSSISTLGGEPSLMVNFCLGKDKSVWINGYKENDPWNRHFWIHDIGTKDGALNPKITIKCDGGNRFRMEGGTILKTGWMKKTGTPDEIKAHVVKFFKKFKTVLEANNIPLDGTKG